MADVSAPGKTSSRRRSLCWDDLDPIEQSLLVVAARERTLDHACSSWAERPSQPIAIAMTKRSAVKLFDNGLVGFYRVEVGYPDLSEVDVRLVLVDNSYWDREQKNACRVGLFLTTAGEDVVLGP